MWILLAILGAFSQAMGAAIKKKSLQTAGMNNVIGFVSFLLAGLVFGALHWAQSGTLWPDHLSARFWPGMLGYAGLNIVAVWFMYRALDQAEFNYLMPYMTLTSLSMMIPPIFVFGEVPHPGSIAGMALVVAGAMAMNWQKDRQHPETPTAEQRARNRKGGLYFLVTALCFTFTPTFAKGAVRESSVLFASCLVHLLISLGFLGLILTQRETGRLKQVCLGRIPRPFLLGVAAAGLAIVIENGCINAALNLAPVAYVMSVKRLMPFFAFAIGYFYFQERTNLRQKLTATALMMGGAIIVTVIG